ncbi:hypothetical protein EDD85DRAFT_868835 [Armillaria nabsnona]|nr:hypothetical protein EDD85DRAFT_868835 [Armillaria nabsnona]
MHTSSSFCDGDGYFRPQSACRSFDLTVVFQSRHILAILPCGLSILATLTSFIVRSISLTNVRLYSKHSLCQITASWIHAITTLLSLIGWTASIPASLPKNAQNIMTVSLVLSFIASIIQLVLASQATRQRTLRFFISLFLLTLVLDSTHV